MRASGALPAAALLGAAACDPCAGIIGCRTDATASASGRILDFPSEAGVAGVRVTFRREGGPSLVGGDSLVATTDGEGLYQLRGPASSDGVVSGTLRVQPRAPLLPYDVGGVTIRATTRRGDGTALPTYLGRPVVAFVGALQLARADVPAALAAVTFVRTGGVRLVRDTLGTTVDPYGRFYLEAAAETPGDAIGTLLLSGGNFPRAFRLDSVRLSTAVVDFVPDVQAAWALGAVADGDVEVRSAAGAAVAGATVEFVRTAGAALTSETTTATTGSNGRATLVLRPVLDEPGAVVGRLTVRLAGATVATLDAVRVPTVDAPTARVLAVITLRRP